MLFSNSNLSAGADGLKWSGHNWSLTNHFIPFTEKEVGASGRFEFDFMSRHVASIKFSAEAKAVMKQGRLLFQRYHGTRFGRTIRDEFKLGRPDAGWFQVRRSLEANAQNEVTDFAPFRSAYAALSEKLLPKVFDLGFLPE